MSERAWLGKGKADWADHNLEDYKDMAELVDEFCWSSPGKVFSDNPASILEFCRSMEQWCCRPPEDFWMFGIRCTPNDIADVIEHPNWPELISFLEKHGYQKR